MTTIILNTEAVNALFPEGSEARVELQKTVLRKLTEQFIKAPEVLEPVICQVKRAADEAQLDALRRMGITKTGYGGYQLNDQAKSAVKAATTNAVGSAINDAVKTLNLDGEIARHVDLIVEQRIREGVRKRLAQISEGI